MPDASNIYKVWISISDEDYADEATSDWIYQFCETLRDNIDSLLSATNQPFDVIIGSPRGTISDNNGPISAYESDIAIAILTKSWHETRHCVEDFEEFVSRKSEENAFSIEMSPSNVDNFTYRYIRAKQFMFWKGNRAPFIFQRHSKEFENEMASLTDAIFKRLRILKSITSATDEVFLNTPSISDLNTTKIPISESQSEFSDQPLSDETPPKSYDDGYRTQTDDPAAVDLLERRPFASVLAKRIVEIRQAERGSRAEDDQAFMIHLHGPWGSGKTSLLRLISDELDVETGKTEPHLVIWFNAWKHQRSRPPWWMLLNTIYLASVAKRFGPDRTRRHSHHKAMRWTWWKWRLRVDFIPISLVAVVLGGLGYALVGGAELGTLETPLKIIAALITAGAGMFTYARLMILGSSKAAQSYSDAVADPFRAIVALFNNLIAKVGGPVVVFIDDLDRCDSDYVVELLEGIQTLLRHAPVTYVIAADRKWICTSFEKKYGDFASQLGEAGRPLGYMFLEKMFQISIGVPRLSGELRARYLNILLGKETSAASAPTEQIEADATARVSGLTDEASIKKAVAATKNLSIAEQRATRAAAAIQITSADAGRDTEHRLQQFAHLLEPNPRSMKRLVNAVGMAQARGLLEGRNATAETHARWVMLSLRWPLLGEYITEEPDRIRYWITSGNGATIDEKILAAMPATIRLLIGNREVIAVVGSGNDIGALTADNLGPLLA